MSTRSLSRRFREQVGTTPAQWMVRARIRRAQRLLETTDLAVERVPAEFGFGSPAVMREHFGETIERFRSPTFPSTPWQSLFRTCGQDASLNSPVNRSLANVEFVKYGDVGETPVRSDAVARVTLYFEWP